MLTDTQIKTIFAVTNIFESGTPEGNYSALVVLPDGAGISYGISQATDGSGSLDQLIYSYLDYNGRYAGELRLYTKALADPDLPLSSDEEFKKLLILASTDPIMQHCQRQLFSDNYWIPARNLGNQLKLQYALSYAILYDISIQSGIGRVSKLRNTFDEVPPVRGGDEKDWTSALAEARHEWLKNYTCSNPKKQSLIRSTSSRAFIFMSLCAAGNWDLDLPLEIRNVSITESDLP